MFYNDNFNLSLNQSLNQYLNQFLIKYNLIEKNNQIKLTDNINEIIIKYCKTKYYLNSYFNELLIHNKLKNYVKSFVNYKINYIEVNNKVLHYQTQNNNPITIKDNNLIKHKENDIYNYLFINKNIEIRYYYSNLLSDGCTYTMKYNIRPGKNNSLNYKKELECEWCIEYIYNYNKNLYIFNNKNLL